MSARAFRPALLILPSMFLSALGIAQSPNEGDQRDKNLQTMLSLVEHIEIRIEGAGEPLVRQPPIQRWSNPIGEGVPDATLFVWTQGRRPTAAAQLFQIGDSPWLQEFQSLSMKPLVGAHDGDRFWATQTPGIKWIDPPPRVPAPARSVNARLVQMRSIARNFTAIQKADTDSPNRLRLLPTPLYRYSDEDDGVLDGGLFSFAAGTDPEVLLLVEAQTGTDTSPPAWKIAFAPMTIFALRVERNGQTIWSVPFRGVPHPLESTFMFFKYP